MASDVYNCRSLSGTLSCLGCLGLIALACGSAQPGTSGPQCDDLDHRARQIWNPTVQEGLDLPVRILSRQYEASEAEQLARGLDEFVLRWETVQEKICRQRHEEQSISEEADEDRRTCLEGSLAQLRRTVGWIDEGDSSIVEKIDSLHEQLSRCAGGADPARPQMIKPNPFLDD